MLQLAQSSAGHPIAQSWTPEGKDCIFNLIVQTCEAGDPLWILEESNLQQTNVIWQHNTIDAGLIHSLIVGESTGQVAAPDREKSNSEITGSLFLRARESQVDQPAITEEEVVDAEMSDEAILQGDISKVRLTTVLQSIQMSKMTGRLAVRTESRGADIYFDDGEAAHASDGVEVGEEVVLDLIQLQSGKFKFIPDERTVKRTIDKNVDRLLLEAITLLDQSEYLNKQNLTSESYLIVKNTTISLEEFTQKVSSGTPVDMELQKTIFKDIGHYKTLLDLLRARPLKRSQWVPVLFNLATCKLISISDKPPQEHSLLELDDSERMERHAALRAKYFIPVRPLDYYTGALEAAGLKVAKVEKRTIVARVQEIVPADEQQELFAVAQVQQSLEEALRSRPTPALRMRAPIRSASE